MHHIKPRSLFPDLIKDKTNVVKLTYREHYVCHWLLTKIYPTPQMIRAFWLFNSWNKNKGYMNSYAYAKSREEYSKIASEIGRQGMLGRHHSEETKEKLRQSKIGNKNPMYGVQSPFKGKHHTEEVKEKCRQVKLGKYDGEKNPMYGKKQSEASKEKNRLSHLGKKHSKESKEKCRQAVIGLKWWNNGIINKRSKECPGTDFIRGRLKKS